jgi:hypothetical protein
MTSMTCGAVCSEDAAVPTKSGAQAGGGTQYAGDFTRNVIIYYSTMISKRFALHNLSDCA